MKLIALLFILTYLLVASPAFAQNNFRITPPGQGYGIAASVHLGDILRNIVILFFTVGGLGFVIMILWGAVDWILSGGDKEKIAAARKRMVTAITGLTVLALSFVIIVITGQVLGINALTTGSFAIPGLGK